MESGRTLAGKPGTSWENHRETLRRPTWSTMVINNHWIIIPPNIVYIYIYIDIDVDIDVEIDIDSKCRIIPLTTGA